RTAREAMDVLWTPQGKYRDGREAFLLDILRFEYEGYPQRDTRVRNEIMPLVLAVRTKLESGAANPRDPEARREALAVHANRLASLDAAIAAVQADLANPASDALVARDEQACKVANAQLRTRSIGTY